MKNKFLLLAAALVLSTTTVFATSQSQASTLNPETEVQGQRTGDMTSQIKEYMADRGVTVVFIIEEQGTQNYIVRDVLDVWYRVYTCDGVIYGADEFDY